MAQSRLIRRFDWMKRKFQNKNISRGNDKISYVGFYLAFIRYGHITAERKDDIDPASYFYIEIQIIQDEF